MRSSETAAFLLAKAVKGRGLAERPNPSLDLPGKSTGKSALRYICLKERNGEQMNPEKIMDGLLNELNSALKAMAKAKEVNEKEVHSRIVKNLCESLGVFLNLARGMMSYDSDDDLDSEDIPF